MNSPKWLGLTKEAPHKFFILMRNSGKRDNPPIDKELPSASLSDATKYLKLTFISALHAVMGLNLTDKTRCSEN